MTERQLLSQNYDETCGWNQKEKVRERVREFTPSGGRDSCKNISLRWVAFKFFTLEKGFGLIDTLQRTGDADLRF